MAGKTLQFFNLTGGLNTVQTMATINATPNRTESPEMVNVEYFKLSGIRTMNGNVALNSGNSIGSRIEFGYEYVKGNNRYMIVADRQNLYEYDATTDTFNTLFTFPYPAETNTYITICGYANGIVAACPNKNNTYLIYYRKDRLKTSLGYTSLGTATTTIGSDEVSVTSTYLDYLGAGDMIIINNTTYEIKEVNTNDNKITLTTNATEDYTGTKFYLTDFTKIYCKAEYDVQYSGITITTFTPKVIHSHQGRLWVAAQPENYDTTAVVIYSDLGSIHDAFKGGDQSVYDGGYFEEFWEDTSDITALGSWDKYVVVHKREHTYLINTSNSDATTWNVESYSEYTCDNQRGYVKANNGYYTFCTSGGGIYPMIQRTIYSAISQGAEASSKIRDTFTNLNQYKLDEIFAVYHPIKKYIMFYMPMIGEDGSKDCYILDLQTRTWLHRKVPQNVTCAFEFDNKVYIGTEDGKVFEEFRGYTFDGEPIPFSWKSPWFIWGGATNFTTTREIRVKMSQEGTNNFFIRNRRDGIEDYKQRKITNSSQATNYLVWDNGILAGDISDGYTATLPVYYYTLDGITYYSLDSKLKPESLLFTFTGTVDQDKINSMAHFSNGHVAASIIGEFDTYDGVIADKDNADKIVPGIDPVYAYTWKGTEVQYLCYQSTQDSNIKIWVDRNDTTQGIMNVEQKQSTQYFAFTGVDYNTRPNGNIVATTSQYVDAIVNGTTQQGIPFWIWNGSSWTNTYNGYPIASGLTAYGIATGYGVGVFVQQGTALVGTYSYSLNQTRNLKLNRAEQYDTGGSYWGWNGNSYRSGITITLSNVSPTDTQITYDNIQYNRYTPGDEGTQSSGETDTVYSSKSVLGVDDIVYTDNTLATQAGTVEAVSGTNYTINSKIYNPDSSQTDYGTNAEYYFIRPLLSTLYDTDGTQYSLSLQQYYPSSDDFVGDNEKVLTDSKWDTSTWVNTGQITRRFPIDRQYFQTLQLEFCGEAENQGIELYGFEVDGIQLTEVPW